MFIVDTVNISVEPKSATEIIRMWASVDDSLQRVDLRLGQTCKHAQLNDITRANVTRNTELSFLLDALAFLTIQMIN